MRHSPIALLLLSSAGLGCHVSISRGLELAENVQREEQHAFELAPGERVVLVSGFGDIQATASEGQSPVLHARVSAGGRTRAEALAVLERYELSFERAAGVLRVELVGEPLRVEGTELGATVEFEAHLPAGTPLEARSGSGRIEARGALGALDLETGFGNVEIDTARGDVRARSGSGKISARHLRGDEIDLNSGFGNISVESSHAKRMKIETGSGSIRVASADSASLELESGFGAIEATEVGGAVSASSGSGKVVLKGVRGAVEASSGFGNVHVEGVLESLRASTGSGSVKVEARPGSRNASGWSLTSDFGSVTLAVPADFACRLDARTSFGSVECDFPLTIDAGKRKGESELRGTIGAGGGEVKLKSGSGAVHLKKL